MVFVFFLLDLRLRFLYVLFIFNLQVVCDQEIICF